MNRSLQACGTLLLCLGAAGCPCPAPAAAPGPEAVLRQYASAVGRKDTAEVRRWMSSRSRERMGEDALARFLVRRGPAVAERLLGQDRPRQTELVLVSDPTQDQPLTLRLIWEDGAWRIDAGSGAPWSGGTPRDALEEFLAAIESGDCAALVACAPPSALQRHTQQTLSEGCLRRMAGLRSMAGELRQAMEHLVQTSDDSATISYGSGGTVRLVRIGGRWFIDDL